MSDFAAQHYVCEVIDVVACDRKLLVLLHILYNFDKNTTLLLFPLTISDIWVVGDFNECFYNNLLLVCGEDIWHFCFVFIGDCNCRSYGICTFRDTAKKFHNTVVPFTSNG